MATDGNMAPSCGSVEPESIGSNLFVVNAHWMTDPKEIRQDQERSRRGRARMKALEDGIRVEHWEKFADAAELTFQQVNFVMSLSNAPSRREMRKHRRALLKAAFRINEVPWLWQKLVRIGTWSGYVLPFPWNVVIPGIFYMLDQMIEDTEKAAI